MTSLASFPFIFDISDINKIYLDLNADLGIKVVGRPFVHSLVNSLGQIHQGLNVHYVKNDLTFCFQTFENFEFLKVLGKGTFGKVILCREKATNQVCILKKLQFLTSCNYFHYN